MLKTMLSEKLKLEVGSFLTILFHLFKQLKTGLVWHFKKLKTNLLKKLKLQVGPLFNSININPSSSQITVISIPCGKITLFLTEFSFDWLFQLEMGLVCHFKMLETMLSEKLKLEVGPLFNSIYINPSSSQITFISILCGKITVFLTEFSFHWLFQLKTGLVCH